jgi:flagellar basal-body rod modification protein FlgD
MSNVGSVTTLPPSNTTSTTGNASSTLTQADFLQLMVAQMTQQDPLSSGDGGGGDSSTSDYVNQLMSMTNLTTMQTMSSQQGVALAQQLPGATVSLTDSSGDSISGVVSATTITTNGVSVTVNGVTYPASDITGITPATTPTSGTGNTASSGS